jgi:hypothetical protein
MAMPSTPSSSTPSTTILSEVKVQILGPVTGDCTVVDEALPRALFAGQKKDKSKPSPCNLAMIEFFHDYHTKRLLHTETWGRMEVLEPDLLPCRNLEENLLDVNAHLLDKDHFVCTHCYGEFSARKYLTDAKAGHDTGDQIRELCRDHKTAR